MVGWQCSVFSWVDYKGVQGKLLCYCLQPQHLIVCYNGTLQSHTLSYNINLDPWRNLLFIKAQLLHRNSAIWVNTTEGLSPSGNSYPNCLIGSQVSNRHLCWNSILLPQALNTAAHISCAFSETFYLPHLRVSRCNIGLWGALGMRREPNEWIIQRDGVQYDVGNIFKVMENKQVQVFSEGENQSNAWLNMSISHLPTNRTD